MKNYLNIDRILKYETKAAKELLIHNINKSGRGGGYFGEEAENKIIKSSVWSAPPSLLRVFRSI